MLIIILTGRDIAVEYNIAVLILRKRNSFGLKEKIHT